MPFSSWLERLWQEYITVEFSASPFLLSNQQENILWIDIIKNSPEKEIPLQISHTAKLAQSAWHLLKQYQISPHDPQLTLTEDGRIFQQWALEFESICKQNTWLDTGNLLNLLTEKIDTGLLACKKNIILVGFTEITPQQKTLLETCQRKNCNIEYTELPNQNNSIKRVSVVDEETEITIMARWAKSIFDQDAEKKPFLIGCVIPQLDSLRDRVWHIFSEVFSENNTFTLDPTLMPFNISAGKNLANYPIIATALSLLKIHQGKIALSVFSNLLLSPFLIAGESEQIQRANFDIELQRKNISTVYLTNLISDAHFCKKMPALAKGLQDYLNYTAGLQSNEKPSVWVSTFIKLLTF